MFGNINSLGEIQTEAPDWYGVKDQSEGDVDFISTKYYSPDAGYGPKRIGKYDAELVQHQTLNAAPASKISAPNRGFMMRALLPLMRTQKGGPRGNVPTVMTPAMKRFRMMFGTVR